MKGKSIQGKRKVKRDSKGKHSSHKHSSEKLEGSIIRPQLYLPHLVGIRPLLFVRSYTASQHHCKNPNSIGGSVNR